MTILSPQSLLHVVELVEAGASIAETTTAIGGAPRSKIIFKWISDSADAGEFGARPDASSPWCIMRGDRLEWFHILVEEARATARAERAVRVSPLRAELEARLAAKRAERAPVVTPSPHELRAPPTTIIEHAIARTAMADPLPPAPRSIPAYAHRSKPIDGTHSDFGPPSEGRFSMTADRPKSQRERQSGLPEITELGVKVN